MDAPPSTRNDDRPEYVIQSWTGGLEVLHAHARAPRSNPLHASVLLREDNAVLRPGTKVSSLIIAVAHAHRQPDYLKGAPSEANNAVHRAHPSVR